MQICVEKQERIYHTSDLVSEATANFKHCHVTATQVRPLIRQHRPNHFTLGRTCHSCHAWSTVYSVCV